MIYIDADTEDWRKLLGASSPHSDADLQRVVARIIEDVRLRGDAALIEFARKFDSPNLAEIKATESERSEAMISDEHHKALQLAYDRILAFHRTQVDKLTGPLTRSNQGWVWRMKEEDIGQRIRPLNSAGLYVPGGLASYPSSVLMLAGPANSVDVAKTAVATPCQADGSLSPAVLVACRIANVKSIYKIGGASAIAAFAFGTESVERVDKIVGPGNKFVNEAKRQLWGKVGVDGNYGPSEVCVVIDRSTTPAYAAADLLAQLEHAPDNLGYVVSLDDASWSAMKIEVDRQMQNAPRKSILEKCLERVKVFGAKDRELAAEIVNEIAPEHLTLSVEDPSGFAERVTNAGCILLGEWTPESAADYVLGPSHTLPTNGASRFANPINALDFLKIQSISNLSKSDLGRLAKTVETIAEIENFPAHAAAATVRAPAL
jgi:histidinol dehydrogenase